MDILPDRRTCVVLASLIGAMTLVSSLLLALEPGPGLAPTQIVTLNAIEVPPASFKDKLFDIAKPLKPWQAIVIHASGSWVGSAKTMDQAQRKFDPQGLGYHFVIHNGQGTKNGEIVMSKRWRDQLDGHYTTGKDAPWFHRHAIGISLIGNFEKHAPTQAQQRELVRLVTSLQRRLKIPASRIVIQTGDGTSQNPGKLFPLAQIQRQFLNVASR